MSDRRILHLVNRLDQASAKYDQASATYRATRDLRWQAAELDLAAAVAEYETQHAKAV